MKIKEVTSDVAIPDWGLEENERQIKQSVREIIQLGVTGT